MVYVVVGIAMNIEEHDDGGLKEFREWRGYLNIDDLTADRDGCREVCSRDALQKSRAASIFGDELIAAAGEKVSERLHYTWKRAIKDVEADAAVHREGRTDNRSHDRPANMEAREGAKSGARAASGWSAASSSPRSAAFVKACRGVPLFTYSSTISSMMNRWRAINPPSPDRSAGLLLCAVNFAA